MAACPVQLPWTSHYSESLKTRGFDLISSIVKLKNNEFAQAVNFVPCNTCWGQSSGDGISEFFQYDYHRFRLVNYTYSFFCYLLLLWISNIQAVMPTAHLWLPKNKGKHIRGCFLYILYLCSLSTYLSIFVTRAFAVYGCSWVLINLVSID